MRLRAKATGLGRLNVAFVVKTLDSRGGGAERVLSQVTAALAELGHQVTLVSFDSPDSPDFYEIDSRIRRVWLAAGRRNRRTSISDAVKRIVALRREARRLRPDMVVGFLHSAYVPLALAMTGTGLPVVASEHIVYDHYRRHPVEGLLLRITARLYSRVVIVSEAVRQTFPPVLRNRMTVIENPVEVRPRQQPRRLITERDVILTVGRLVAQKDQSTLIAAFARVADDHPEWTLRIVGEGELRDRLEAQARELGLADRVEFPGPTREIWREYAAARIFVLPSTYESLGLATAEALSAGLPSIGFADCPGTNELIQDEVNGLLVGPGDRVTGMANALARLVSSPEERRRMAAAAPASVKQLSVQAVASRWEELLSRLAHGRSLPAIELHAK